MVWEIVATNELNSPAKDVFAALAVANYNMTQTHLFCCGLFDAFFSATLENKNVHIPHFWKHKTEHIL